MTTNIDGKPRFEHYYRADMNFAILYHVLVINSYYWIIINTKQFLVNISLPSKILSPDFSLFYQATKSY